MIGFANQTKLPFKNYARAQHDRRTINSGKELAAPSVAVAANPFQRQLDEARAEWKRRKES
jgi:hypothetical protein